jgi:hypothetical protein
MGELLEGVLVVVAECIGEVVVAQALVQRSPVVCLATQ